MKNVTFRSDEEMTEKIAQLARANKRTFSNMLRFLVELGIESYFQERLVGHINTSGNQPAH